MDVRIDIEKKFDKDIKHLSSHDQGIIEKKVNQLIEFLKTGQNTSSHLSKIHKFRIGADMDSSLYVLTINRNLRIILTSEEDPLFNEHILTLLRVVKYSDLDKTFRGLAEAFRQSFIHKGGKANG